jgi:hypothetical protein
LLREPTQRFRGRFRARGQIFGQLSDVLAEGGWLGYQAPEEGYRNHRGKPAVAVQGDGFHRFSSTLLTPSSPGGNRFPEKRRCFIWAAASGSIHTAYEERV